MAKKDYGSSNRRKFLIGAGSIAAGGSALLGTAATTTFNLNERGVAANVVTDATAAVQLIDQENSGIVNETDGRLEIDFAEASGADGVNVGSRVQIGGATNATSFGSQSEDNDDVAFDIVNQTTDTVSLDMTLRLNKQTASNEASTQSPVDNSSRLQFEVGDGTSVQVLEVGGGSSGDNEDTLNGSAFLVPAGESLGVCVEVFADENNSSTSDDLSSTFDITATQD